jgi:ankyrin repeat protein
MLISPQARDTEAIRVALENSDVIHSEDRSGMTLLQVAAYMGNLDAMRLLVNMGANVNSRFVLLLLLLSIDTCLQR